MGFPITVIKSFKKQNNCNKSIKRNSSRYFFGPHKPGTSCLLQFVKKSSAKNRKDNLVADVKPNAAVAGTMAPALTEPLSPTEKLTSSTTTLTTRSSSRKVESLATTSSAPSVSTTAIAATVTTASISKEKKSRSSVAASATTSTRVTRSKDAYQRVFEQALANNPSQSDINTANNPKICGSSKKNCNEPMGLNAALKNNNNNKSDESRPESNTISPSNKNKDPSTKQLLADLTDDFEEAITAEICLRKQLEDANLSKSADAEVNHAENAPKDILVIKGSSCSISKNFSPDTKLEKRMESPQLDGVETTPSSSRTQSKEAKYANEISAKREKRGVPTFEHTEEKLVTEKEQLLEDAQTLSPARIECSLRPQILAVEELPPISTDSTMTASEVEDNLEERLSQLDGTAISSSTGDISGVVEAMCSIPVISSLSATPPRSPTQVQLQHQQQTHQQQVLQLQHQLQPSPTTPVSPQPMNQQQTVLTPQSTTSSVNTLGSTSLTQAFMKEAANTVGTGGSGELEDQDIEEVLKVLKGFDGTAGGDPLPDLNVLFNEVYTTFNNYEEISSQPASTTTSKPSPLTDMLTEIEKKQQSMQRKMEFLLRRMRKLQARHMCKQNSEEVAGLFEYAARVGSKGSTGNLTHSHSLEEASLSTSQTKVTRPFILSWAEELRNPVSSTQIYTMLRKIETVANAQQLCTSRGTLTHGVGTSVQSGTHGHVRKYKKADALSGLPVPAAVKNEQAGVTVVPTLDLNVTEELAYVSGLLQTEMREVQNALDSDATESSSGGESADEMVTYNNQLQQSLSIAKRAAWRYSRDRAAIASRWSWLLSQIADLEIKIRQHSELHQEIVRTKGAVTNAVSSDNEATMLPLNSSVNGYKGDYNSAVTIEIKGDDEVFGSCRTRGYVATAFRKRKLLQTDKIHTISKKAARPSTVKCGCQWPLLPCALCTGRSDPTAPRDLPDTMMMPDRVALLDPGFHPVLSFPEDVSNCLHFETISRLPEWQQRVMRCQVKSIAKSVWKAEREAAAAAGHSTTKRRYIKKKDRLAEKQNASDDNTTVKANTTTAKTQQTSATNSSSNLVGATAGGIGAEVIGGNGTGNLSTTSTTPLVANKLLKNSKKLHCHLVGDGVLLEPLSPLGTSHNNHNLQNHGNNSSYIHQTSDYPHRLKYDPYNPNQTHSSSISINNSSSNNNNNSHRNSNKHRKLSSTSITNSYHHAHYHYQQQQQQHYYSNSSYHNNNSLNGGNEMSLLFTNDNWDSYTVRSRTSSPTHSGSNYHKYERSLDRKNRSSYDIDNIVIPYSVAAATRVEILPYKEIPTPKWRVIHGNERSEEHIQSSEEEEDVAKKPKENGLATRTTKKTENQAEPDMLQADCKDKEENKTDFQEQIAVDHEQVNTPKQGTTEKTSNCNVGTESSVITPPNTISNCVNEEPLLKKIKIGDLPICSDDQPTDANTSREASANTSNDNDDDDLLDVTEEEDITNDTMMLRHERALTEERRKFQTFLKFPWSTRSRANRRIDSRAESSGANTPDPTSPAPNTPSVGGGDQESIPSPLAPSTPLNPLDVADVGENTSVSALTTPQPLAVSSNFNSKRYERRRTTSAKKENERRSSTPDPKELIPPYEPLKFPLPDEVFDSLQHTLPVAFCDDIKFQYEDCQNLSGRYLRQGKNNFKNDASMACNSRRTSKSAAAAAAMNCDVNANNSKRHKIPIPNTNNRGGGVGAAGSGRGIRVIYENGKEEKDYLYGLPNGLLEEEELEEEEDYPRHHLAPPPDDNGNNERYVGDDAYHAYVGRGGNILDDSEESTDMEPFQDDDPNDPEWKNECGDRTERLRKKL